MRTLKLPDAGELTAYKELLVTQDHCLFTDRLQNAYQMEEHDASFGVVYNLYGDCNFRLNGRKNQVGPDSFLLVNQPSLLSMCVKQPGTQPVLLYFQKGTANQVASSLYVEPEKLMDAQSVSFEMDFSLLERLHRASAAFKSRLNLLASMPDSCSSFFALKSDAIVRSILEELLMANKGATTEALRLNVIKKSTRVEIYKRLYKAKEWMEANYNLPVTLNDLAGVALLNSQHFLRLFKQLFGQTPHQLLMDLRIEAASKLLATSSLSVTQVCNQVGWDSLPSFSNLFKSRQGVSPTQFRNESRGNSC